MYGKSTMETYITICKIDSQWELAVLLRKLKQGLCINPEGWNGEQDGREVQKGGDICIPYGWFILSFDRKQQNSVKQLSFSKKKLIERCGTYIHWKKNSGSCYLSFLLGVHDFRSCVQAFNPVWGNFLCGIKYQFHSSAWGSPVSPTPFIEETVLLHNFGFFVVN